MITLRSHGFKFGKPDCNYFFDVSLFKNPWRDDSIRNEADLEKRRNMIMEFMNKQEGCSAFVDKLASLIRLLYVLYPKENLQIALCCSAGEYRSPALVELLSCELSKAGIEHKVEQSKYSKI